ncbi:MAG: hypothetical protein ACI8Q1_000702 [Parvicella sp.]|jgi:hypothetical protein
MGLFNNNKKKEKLAKEMIRLSATTSVHIEGLIALLESQNKKYENLPILLEKFNNGDAVSQLSGENAVELIELTDCFVNIYNEYWQVCEFVMKLKAKHEEKFNQAAFDYTTLYGNE